MITKEFLLAGQDAVMRKYQLPAVATAVLNSQRVEALAVQGVCALGREPLATAESYFHIGSCAKSLLGVMAAKLVEQGVLQWDTPFFAVLPELREASLSIYADITLEQLFRCQAGIRSYTNASIEPILDFGPVAHEARLAFAERVLKQAPVVPPRDGVFGHVYSNASYTLVAVMLERIAGEHYEPMAARTLEEMCGAKVHFGWPNSLHIDQPWGHFVARGQVTALPPEHEYKLPAAIGPAGDLSMTVSDFTVYVQTHLRGLRGEDGYLRADSFRHLHFGHRGFSIGTINGAFLGRRFSGFDGSAGTFFCRAAIFPDDDFALVIMTNAASGHARAPAIDKLSGRIIKERFKLWWAFWM